jgi:hypothetical protein
MSSAIDRSVERVAGVVHDWLVAEVESSSGDRNQYLDDFSKWQQQIRLGYDDDRNWTSNKNRAHLDRLPIWWQAYELDPLHDEASAKITFAGLIFISGAYRNQSYFQAQDADDYQARRAHGVGIDLESAVSTRLNTHLPRTGSFKTANITLETLDERRKQAAVIGEQTIKTVCARAYYGYDLGQENSRSVNEMKQDQYAWATFVTDAVTLAAKLRGGDLDAVPFLHPVNISDNPGVIYPFAS